MKSDFMKRVSYSLKEKIAYIVVFFQVKWDGIRLMFAIHMANALQKAKNKRFYILENNNGKLIWLCNDDIKVMKKPKKVRKLVNGHLIERKVWMIDPNTTHLDVMKQCMYYTPESWNNKNGISVEERNKKREKWLDYMEKIRMERMFGKLRMR